MYQVVQRSWKLKYSVHGTMVFNHPRYPEPIDKHAKTSREEVAHAAFDLTALAMILGSGIQGGSPRLQIATQSQTAKRLTEQDCRFYASLLVPIGFGATTRPGLAY